MTTHDARLAICGGVPAFSEVLHVGRPNVGERAALFRRLDAMMDRNWLTNDGPLVREFEGRIAEYIGVSECVAICNATVALELVIRAAGLTGEVIVPSYTFIATAHALQWQEITPIFCDISPETHNLNPDLVERMITPRTMGIIGVHLWGRAAPVERLSEIAQKHRLALLFDAAHAFGCSHGGRLIGRFGLAEVFSFHATKFLNSMEGGAVVTNDRVFAEKLRLMRNFGFAGHDNVIHIGTNGKMTEATAAMGLTNLDSIDRFIERNYANYKAYQLALQDVPGLSLIRYDSQERNNFQYVVIEVDEARFGLSRDELVSTLHAENVLARKYFWPGCHRMEPYRSYFPHASLLLPETDRVAARVVVLPTGMAVDTEAIGRISGILSAAHESAAQIREAIANRPRVRK